MRFMNGQRVQVRLGESRRGANDGGWWEAEFIDYVGGDGCLVKWPRWGKGFSPQDRVSIDNVRPMKA
jgi:hypothetical protein